MEHIARLVQTVFWVGLIGIVLRRFHKQIDGLLVALQRHVEAGGTIKAQGFELWQLTPQDPAAQMHKAETDVDEALGEISIAVSPGAPDEGSRTSVKARYFQAEDLVLRATS